MNNVIYVWACSWHGLTQRHQQIMRRLAEKTLVLYVESPMDVSTLCKTIFLKKISLKQVFKQAIFGYALNDKLIIYTPLVPFSLRRYPVLNKIWMCLFRRYLGFLTWKWKVQNYILFICYPLAEELVGSLNEVLSCYDCCDDLTDISGTLSGIVNEYELRLVKKVDLILTTTPVLVEKFRRLHNRILLIPNAADVEHFMQAVNCNLQCPDDLKNISKPIIGFVGAVQHWVDTPLLKEIAKLRPHWNFVIIGPVHNACSDLYMYKNLHFLGRKPYHALPAYLKHIQVGIVPFKQNKIVFAADPIKIYEYLASGLPVVSTPMPKLKDFLDLVRIAETPMEFVKQIEDALHDNSAEAIMKRVNFAKEHSWDKRVEQLVLALNKTLWETSEHK